MELKHIIYGAIIGVANIIPGVSGGTMAVILKVYDRIIQSVSNLKKDFRNSIKFLIPIGIGAVLGIVLFSRIIEFCLENFSTATNLVFVGLIVGSIPMIFVKTKEKKMNVSAVVVFVICLAIMVFMKVANPEEDATKVITELNIRNFFVIFFALFVSAGAMIIPGISGSFVMLLLGVYTTILTAISSFNIPILFTIALGCLAGILTCAKIIDKLFAHFPQQTYSGILGLMLGSIIVLTPAFTISIEFFVGVLLAVFAGVGAYLFSRK